jgi:Uma2 family endonuclease
MAKPQPKPWTLQEFLAWEESEPDKFELVDGVVFAMAGGTAAHARLAVNTQTALHRAVEGGPCQVFNSDMKVVAEHFSAYPDASVVCTPVLDEATTLEAPVVIVEVLSSSTSSRDYGSKWRNYREIESLQHYVLIAQDRRYIELMSRENGGWHTTIHQQPNDTIELRAIGARFTLAELYEGTRFATDRVTDVHQPR